MDLSKVFYLNTEPDYPFPQDAGIEVVTTLMSRTQTDNQYIISLRPRQFDAFINKIREAINCVAVICLELDTMQIVTLFQLPDLVVYVGMPSKELLVTTLSDASEAKRYMDRERKTINTVRTFEHMLLTVEVN